MLLPQKGSYTTMYIFFAWTFGICYSFVLLSATAGASGVAELPIFEPGKSWTYQYQITALLNEKGQVEKDVGFFISSEVLLESVWGNSNHERLLKMEMKNPKLFIKSRKAPAPEGFVQHKSPLESLPNSPFYVLWNKGKVEKILLQKDEQISISNIKKGIASLFQILDGEVEEIDSSGKCKVSYYSISPTRFRKRKTQCESKEFPYAYNPDLILGIKINSERISEYDLNDKTTHVKELLVKEIHEMYLSAKEEAGNKIEVNQHLSILREGSAEVLTGSNFEDLLASISQNGAVTEESLLTEREESKEKEQPNLLKAISNQRENLQGKHLGRLHSAKVFINLVKLARKANKDEINKILTNKKNKQIMLQIYDVLGFAQNYEAHEALMKKLHFDEEKTKEEGERYLWALSMSSHPNPEILKDLLKRFQRDQNIRIRETLILTIASMGYRLKKLDAKSNKKLQENVRETILNNLDSSKGEDRYVFLRALKNLKSETTMPPLLSIIKSGSQKEGSLAWQAIKSIPTSPSDPLVIEAALKTFFQLDKKHDSSARTLAIDVLLASDPKENLIEEILRHLSSEDKSYEVKKYALQSIRMKSDEDEDFRKKVASVLKKNPKINNYGVLSVKGLTTALSRKFFETKSSNGTLLSLQEMNSGIVKRGVVSILLSKEKETQEICNLGIFSGGLSSFLSSDSDNGQEADEEEETTAGMEIGILGTNLRPFVFFTGQGELMGHVWSGTASEMTSAYQALVMLQDHLEYLRLGAGIVAELDVKGVASFDLSGKVEISLWNRNAESLVEKSAGIIVFGLLRVDTSFVKARVEFNIAIEPKLQLQTDINFYGTVSLCMRLSQPETLLRHNVIKIERIPGSKHKLRKVKYSKSVIPGRTYALNKKNSEMCNAIFN